MNSTFGPVMASGDADLGVALAAVIILGVGAQLLGSRLHIPSILLLLGGGVLAGPVLEIIEPDELLGPLLFPAVSLAVGILLFEGGLGLRFAQLERQGRGPILRLVTIGVVVTWLLGALGAYLLLDIRGDAAVLLGAILAVSGPTVVLPLLRFVPVREPVNGILRWEGIFIDPIGATLAIVVLDTVVGSGGEPGLSRIFTTAASGTSAGLAAAGLVVVMFRKHWVPDHLHNPFTLAMVVSAFAAADALRPEAGLFAATIMGVALANQRWAPIAHIREFEENLGSLILAGLFVILGANVDLDQLSEFLPEALALSLVLIVVVRPIAVYASTVGSGLSLFERAYLVCMSPRGIVAASVSALFALELEDAGKPVRSMVPVTFIVITVTVLYSAIASRVGAKRFRVARPEPRGLAFVGGPDWAIDLAEELGRHDVPTMIVTTDPLEVTAAASRDVLTYSGKVDSEDLLHALDSVGIRSVIAISRFEELNSLVIEKAAEHVGRANIFHLPRTDADGDNDEVSTAHSSVMARRPFNADASQLAVERLRADGAILLTVTRDDFDSDALAEALPLVGMSDDVGASVLTAQTRGAPGEGVRRIYLAQSADVGDSSRQGNGGSSSP